MNAFLAALRSINMQSTMLEVDLAPAQLTEFLSA
jgi:hypothetical protein